MSMFLRLLIALAALVLVAAYGVGCGNEAVERGVGAACTTDADCTEVGQACLDFKGGYCGIANCTDNGDCPDGSACVTLIDDGKNYCFLVCVDKAQCNVHRSVDDEANCSSTKVTFVDGDMNSKTCVPPSS